MTAEKRFRDVVFFSMLTATCGTMLLGCVSMPMKLGEDAIQASFKIVSCPIEPDSQTDSVEPSNVATATEDRLMRMTPASAMPLSGRKALMRKLSTAFAAVGTRQK